MAVKLYIGNLPRKLTRNELLEHFANFGHEILKLELGIDREGRFLGYCYITVGQHHIAEKIYDEYNNSQLLNKNIRIAETFHRCQHNVYRGQLITA